jgi:hypothetical protein
MTQYKEILLTDRIRETDLIYQPNLFIDIVINNSITQTGAAYNKFDEIISRLHYRQDVEKQINRLLRLKKSKLSVFEILFLPNYYTDTVWIYAGNVIMRCGIRKVTKHIGREKYIINDLFVVKKSTEDIIAMLDMYNNITLDIIKELIRTNKVERL